MGSDSRLYYYVEDASSGWTLAIREAPGWVSPIDYATRDEAFAAAVHLAQQDWRTHGRPTGVRVVQRAGGGWDEHSFGAELAATERSVE